MSLTGIDNLSYLTYGAIGLTGIILAVATAYDRGDGDYTPTESAPLFTEPIIPALPDLSSEQSEPSGPGPLAQLVNSINPKKEESILPDVFGSSDKEESSVLPNVFVENEPKKEPGILPATGGKKKKRRTKKSKAGKKHRKTKHKHTKK
jgi:hypothetical protein